MRRALLATITGPVCDPVLLVLERGTPLKVNRAYTSLIAPATRVRCVSARLNRVAMGHSAHHSIGRYVFPIVADSRVAVGILSEWPCYAFIALMTDQRLKEGLRRSFFRFRRFQRAMAAHADVMLIAEPLCNLKNSPATLD